MTAEDFETHLRGLGLSVEVIAGQDGLAYSMVKGVELTKGSLRGQRCDIAIQRVETVPYVPPAAIHTRPHLVPMDSNEPLRTMNSGIGPEWQYWSRRFDPLPTPKALWTHILTVLGDDRWPSA